jgi:hypothetical protein
MGDDCGSILSTEPFREISCPTVRAGWLAYQHTSSACVVRSMSFWSGRERLVGMLRKQTTDRSHGRYTCGRNKSISRAFMTWKSIRWCLVRKGVPH